MKNTDLDQNLRRALHGDAPDAVHLNVEPRFRELARRFSTDAAPRAPTRKRHRALGWRAVFGLFSTVAAAILFFSLAPAAVRAEVDFVGILATRESARFYLVDRATGRASGWISLRQDFAGFSLTNYDSKSDVLTLTKDGVETKVRLADAKVQNARLEVRGSVTLDAGEKLEVERATLVLGVENSFPLKNGVTIYIKPTQREDGNMLYEMRYERRRADGTPQQLGAPAVIAIPGHEFSLVIGSPENPSEELGFRFKPTTQP